MPRSEREFSMIESRCTSLSRANGPVGFAPRAASEASGVRAAFFAVPCARAFSPAQSAAMMANEARRSGLGMTGA